MLTRCHNLFLSLKRLLLKLTPAMIRRRIRKSSDHSLPYHLHLKCLRATLCRSISDYGEGDGRSPLSSSSARSWSSASSSIKSFSLTTHWFFRSFKKQVRVFVSSQSPVISRALASSNPAYKISKAWASSDFAQEPAKAQPKSDPGQILTWKIPR